MFRSKKKLLCRIADLEKEVQTLRYHKMRSALIDKSALPKCKSVACAKCDHAVYLNVPGHGYMLMGCGKDLDCEDFKERIDRIPVSQAIQLLIEQGLEWRSPS